MTSRSPKTSNVRRAQSLPAQIDSRCYGARRCPPASCSVSTSEAPQLELLGQPLSVCTSVNVAERNLLRLPSLIICRQFDALYRAWKVIRLHRGRRRIGRKRVIERHRLALQLLRSRPAHARRSDTRSSIAIASAMDACLTIGIRQARPLAHQPAGWGLGHGAMPRLQHAQHGIQMRRRRAGPSWYVDSLNSKPRPKRVFLWASNRPFRDGHHIGRSHSLVSWCRRTALGYRICGWAELRCARSVGLPLPLHVRSFRT